MKRLIFLIPILSIAVSAVSCSRKTMSYEQYTEAAREYNSTLDGEHRQRMNRREQRQAENARNTDALIESGTFRFQPWTFSLMPAGATQRLNDNNYDLTFYEDYADIFVPFYAGSTPPYRLTTLNTVIQVFDDYKAEKTADGWEINFRTRLYANNTYYFTLSVYSATGTAELTIKADFGNTVKYNGNIFKIN